MKNYVLIGNIVNPTMTSISKPHVTARGPNAADRILKAARELFYRKGIRAVGVDEIVSSAGVTKPSLYRGFASKDELVASYLKVYEQEFWDRFNSALAQHPGDPRSGLLAYMAGLAERTAGTSYRGCGLSNAAVEYPDSEHPGRLVSEEHKHRFRARLRGLAADMGAGEPDRLGDGLLLLIEGSFMTGQIFHADGPAAALVRTAELLIDASTRS